MIGFDKIIILGSDAGEMPCFTLGASYGTELGSSDGSCDGLNNEKYVVVLLGVSVG